MEFNPIDEAFHSLIETILSYGYTLFEFFWYSPFHIYALPFLFSIIAFIIFEIYKLIVRSVQR